MTRNIVAIAFAICMLTGAGAWAQGNAATATVAKTGTASAVMLKEGEAVVTRGKGLSRRVTNMLSGARRESDIIRITCLSDKLTQINAQLGNAEGRFVVLRRSVDPQEQRHEYTVLMVLGQKFIVLDQESAQCVGQAMFETGTTRVQTDIDPATQPYEDVDSASPPSMSPARNPGQTQNDIMVPSPVSGTM